MKDARSTGPVFAWTAAYTNDLGLIGERNGEETAQCSSPSGEMLGIVIGATRGYLSTSLRNKEPAGLVALSDDLQCAAKSSNSR